MERVGVRQAGWETSAKQLVHKGAMESTVRRPADVRTEQPATTGTVYAPVLLVGRADFATYPVYLDSMDPTVPRDVIVKMGPLAIVLMVVAVVCPAGSAQDATWRVREIDMAFCARMCVSVRMTQHAPLSMDRANVQTGGRESTVSELACQDSMALTVQRPVGARMKAFVPGLTGAVRAHLVGMVRTASISAKATRMASAVCRLAIAKTALRVTT